MLGQTVSCGCYQKDRIREALSGNGSYHWNGGKTKDKKGYVVLSGFWNHSNSRRSGAIAEHILVMSQMLNRPLRPGENVHHRNGNRADNRPENLELWLTKQPSGQRIPDLVTYAKEILQRYEPEALVDRDRDSVNLVAFMNRNRRKLTDGSTDPESIASKRTVVA